MNQCSRLIRRVACPEPRDSCCSTGLPCPMTALQQLPRARGLPGHLLWQPFLITTVTPKVHPSCVYKYCSSSTSVFILHLWLAGSIACSRFRCNRSAKPGWLTWASNMQMTWPFCCDYFFFYEYINHGYFTVNWSPSVKYDYDVQHFNLSPACPFSSPLLCQSTSNPLNKCQSVRTRRVWSLIANTQSRMK